MSDVTAGAFRPLSKTKHLLWHHWLRCGQYCDIFESFHPQRAAFFSCDSLLILLLKHDKWVYRKCDMNYASSDLNNRIWINVCTVHFPVALNAVSGATPSLYYWNNVLDVNHFVDTFLEYAWHTVFWYLWKLGEVPLVWMMHVWTMCL